MSNSGINAPAKWAVASFAVIVAFFILREHWGHLLGFVPYLLLLACPLMHLFHGHGRHTHKMHDDSEHRSKPTTGDPASP